VVILGVGSFAPIIQTHPVIHFDVLICSRSSWQGKINALKSLDLCYSNVKDSHIRKFHDLSSLEELNLDSCLVGDSAIAHLADNEVVPNLTSLDLADTRLTDLGMSKIATFSNLTRLSLFYCNISNHGLRHLSNLSKLRVLNLDSRDISDDGLVYLRRLSSLQSLDIFSGRITDSGCAHIAQIQSLESLELCGGGIGDLGCTLLAGLEKLTKLNLSQNDHITNRGAAALATLTNLKALNLSNTRVSSSALKFFSGLQKLQSLALYGCQGVDEDEVVLDKLQKELPNLKCLRLNSVADQDGMVVDNDENESWDKAAGSKLWIANSNSMVDDETA
jgi:Leucine-rich repeat (LRR) protein